MLDTSPHLGSRDTETAGKMWASGQVLPLGYAASSWDVEAQVELLKLVIESGSRTVEAFSLASPRRMDGVWKTPEVDTIHTGWFGSQMLGGKLPESREDSGGACPGIGHL